MSRKSNKRIGHFQLHSALVIGHKELPGYQRVMCHPFTGKRFRGGNRQDLVFVRPPGVRDFRLTIDAVWFCRILLLFSFETETEAGIKRHECAFVSVLWEYDEGRPGVTLAIYLLNASKFV
jgi:hypothetical protein